MKTVTIFGTGSVGGFLLCKLAASGLCKMSIVSRNEPLARMRSQGHMKIVEEGSTTEASGFEIYDVTETERIGHQDYVICCVKGNNLSSALPSLRPMVGSRTCLINLQNGLPFWHNIAITHPKLQGKPIQAVDPGGALLAAFEPHQLAGCVAYIAAEKPQPDVVQLNYATKFTHFHFGEALRGPSSRLEELVSIINRAGVPAFVETDIHSKIWNKILVSTSANTTNMLTGGTAHALIRHPGMRAVMRNILTEMHAIGVELGVRFDQTVDGELEALTQRFPKAKFSMGQDAEAGRELEIGPYVTAVTEIAAELGIDIPVYSTVAALVQHWAENHPPRAR